MAPLKSTKGRTTSKLLTLFQSSVLGRGVAPEPFSATGGNQSAPGAALEPGNGFAYHAFTSPGTLVADGSTGICEVLIVGGGGGGADYAGPGNAGGGGGAGGLVHHTQLEIGVGSHAIVVGAGGADNPSPHGSYIGNDGEDTTAFGIVAKGGGPLRPGAALTRSLRAFIVGLGLMVHPFLTGICHIFCLWHVLRRNKAPWDLMTSTRVEASPPRRVCILRFCLLFLAVVVLLSLVLIPSFDAVLEFARDQAAGAR